MLLLEFGNLGLKALHGSGGVELLYSQGIHQPTDNKSQDNNRKPEAAKKDVRQPNYTVYHGLENY